MMLIQYERYSDHKKQKRLNDEKDSAHTLTYHQKPLP